MTTETLFATFGYFFSDLVEAVPAIAFFLVFILIILYYTNRE